MANYAIKQVKVTSPEDSIDDFNQVIKVGIQGPAGTQFTINDGTLITLGKYGVYELDVSELGFLTSLSIKSIPDSGIVYVDYVYYSAQGGAAI